MKGQRLYEIYLKKLKDQGVEADAWTDIDASDQTAWEGLAEELEAESPQNDD